MGAGAWHANAGFADEMGGATDDRRGAYRGVWSTAAHKYLTACRGRSPVFEVFDDRSPHRRRERISGGIACFAIPNLEPFVAPVNVIKRERGDLRSPQSIGCEQHHHCVVALAGGGPSVDTCQHLLDLFPTDRSRNTSVPVRLRKLDKRTEILGQTPLTMEVAQKDP